MKYGLALGGGGTKGVYHLGVWQALCDIGIEVGCITGTSIGAINGAVIAQGDINAAVELWKNITISGIIDIEKIEAESQNLLDAKNILKVATAAYKNNGLETAPLRELITDVVDEQKLRTSEIDFGLTTYELDEFEETELFAEDIPEGQLVDYIMASASLPGLKSTTINDKKYIDGCVANNIPADMMIKKGYKNIICVDVGGIGVVKGVQNTGINVIYIKCSENVIGHFDFNEESIAKMMKLGYYDTLKAFEYIEGEQYNFNISDYHKSRIKYSKDIMNGIEYAAQIFGIDRLKIYRFEDLKNAVVNAYKKEEERDHIMILDGGLSDRQLIARLPQNMISNSIDAVSEKLIKGLRKNTYTAANAVAYFIRDEKN